MTRMHFLSRRMVQIALGGLKRSKAALQLKHTSRRRFEGREKSWTLTLIRLPVLGVHQSEVWNGDDIFVHELSPTTRYFHELSLRTLPKRQENDKRIGKARTRSEAHNIPKSEKGFGFRRLDYRLFRNFEDYFRAFGRSEGIKMCTKWTLNPISVLQTP